jgi:serine/threonine protein phosphatase PrpC
MNLSISGFTHHGTVKDTNEDCILMNDLLLSEGDANLSNQDHCFCFVADGVGGNNAGDFASRYVLQNVRSLKQSSELEGDLCDVNTRLLAETKDRVERRGAATTLTGLAARNGSFAVLHAGDSQLWLLRNEILFKVTNDQVLNEDDENSPITSFFGGVANDLRFDKDIFVREISIGDIFLLCSDGLFKSLDHKTVKGILNEAGDIRFKSAAILKECLQRGAEDNVSAVLIERGS